MRKFVFLIVVFARIGVADVHDDTGLKMAASVDLVGSAKLFDSPMGIDRLAVREAELVVFSPTDHLFDGRLSLAAHEETGKYLFEVHEAYLGSTRLIPRSRFRVGQFFLGIGRLNQFHRHDWPFISAPRYHKEFMGDGVDVEAAIDTGLEFSYLLPFPFYLDVTVGLTNGWVLGHAHSLGDKAKTPTHYLRLLTYAGLAERAGLQVGLNYLGRVDSTGVGTMLLGVDATAKWSEAKVTKLLLQSEVWYRAKGPSGPEPEKAIGLYVFPNYCLDFLDLYAGLRFDLFKQLNLKNAVGDPLGNIDYAVVPTISYRPSEFTTIRLAYHYGQERRDGDATVNNHKIEGQAVFIMGAHPAHDF